MSEKIHGLTMKELRELIRKLMWEDLKERGMIKKRKNPDGSEEEYIEVDYEEEDKYIELADEEDSKVIKEASQMSLQKKEQRFVINLPEWLKERLKKKADKTGSSMNEIIRLALTEYLSK